jgi:hypothetical protein
VTVEAILDAPPDDPLAEPEVILTAEKQLRLIALAIPHWRRAAGAAPDDGGAAAAWAPAD